MTPQDKQATYWTAGILIALVAVLVILGNFLGWFEPASVPKA